MPIYGYRCAACGHQKDVLQKMSDAPLTECPSCGEAAYTKEVSAPAFQLKGTGWYVTDFRDGGKKPDAAKDAKGGEGGESTSSDAGKDSSSSSDSKSADSKSSDAKSSDTKATDKSSAGDKKASPAPASTPASKD